MKLIRDIATAPPPERIQGGVVTIGNFDGVHLGHQAIMREVINQARQRGGTSVAFTFRPHPQIALRPQTRTPLLTTYEEKLELIAAQGIDVIVEQPFSREFSTTTPEQFFHEVLLKRLGAQAIVVGYDFAFGKGREGSLDALRELCDRAGVALTVVSAMRVALPDGSQEIVSSSRIRHALIAGEMQKAQALLGRPYFLRGLVFRGDGRGRKIGFPTANIQMSEEKLLPPSGVYATRAQILGSSALSGHAGLGKQSAAFSGSVAAATNIGVRPTFSEATPGVTVEAHLLGIDQDLYGAILELEFVARLRGEQRFESVAQLIQQIRSDLEAVKNLIV